MANDRSTQQDAGNGRNGRILHGRDPILTTYTSIDRSNVVQVLNECMLQFAKVASEVSYLWKYMKGRQPVLDRVKDVRPEINNRIVENHAQEIVAFKTGYQLAEPIQYMCRNSDDPENQGRTKDINELNTMMFAEDKASCDRDLFEWMCVCGVGYRLIVADSKYDAEEGGAPFELFTLDPRSTFVIESASYHRRPLAGVWVSVDPQTKHDLWNVYTDDMYYLIEGGQIVKEQPHTYKRCPVIMYPLNSARMGVFEPALPLLDAINTLESNRIDGVEQTVQSLIKFVNVDIDEKGFAKMLELGAVKVSSREGITGDVDVIRNDLDQTQTQVTKDDLYQAVVNIVGMPNRIGTSGSSSDTGAAVLLRDGWTLAEALAKAYELQIKRSERNMLRVALEICRQASGCELDLRIRDIELTFNRRNYENALVRSQVLTTMLASEKIHPKLAFESSGLFSDPDAAYLLSQQHFDDEGACEKRLPAQEPSPRPLGSQAAVPEPKR